MAIDRPAGETPLTDAARGCSSPPYTSSVTPPDIPIPPNIATPIGKATAGRESNPAYDALADPVLPLQDVVLKSQIPRLFIIPSHINLAVTELEFGGRIGRERLSKKKIDPTHGWLDVPRLEGLVLRRQEASLAVAHLPGVAGPDTLDKGH
ncbi:MAG: hypothetical protein DRI79_08085 [Chloroflexi bacterium]|nr:MAG: hypothetical protein DRI79_08085 [Chloroflexota bacterium]